MAADDAGAGGVGGQPYQGDDLWCLLSAVGEAAGPQEGAGGGGAQDPGGDLAPVEGGDGVPRAPVTCLGRLTPQREIFRGSHPTRRRRANEAIPAKTAVTGGRREARRR